MKRWGMSRLDRYIFFKFLGNYGLFLGLVMLIAVVFDISQKLDNFISQGASVSAILGDYYVNFIAFYGTTFTGLIVFLSTIFFTGRMADQTEITAVLTGGVSFQRLLKPYFLGSTVVFVLTATLSHFIIPQTNIRRIHFEDTCVQDVMPSRPINIHRQVLPEHFVYVETWSPERLGGYHFTYERFDQTRMLEKLECDFIRFDTIRQLWQLDNWTRRTWNDQGTQLLSRGRRLDTAFSFGPSTISPDLRSTATMTSPALWTFLQQERLSGSEAVIYHEMEWYRRTAYPFSVYILVLIAVALASEKRRGGIGAQIAMGLLLAVTYIFVMQLSGIFVASPYITPWLAVWMPNLLFAVLGVYLYLRAAK